MKISGWTFGLGLSLCGLFTACVAPKQPEAAEMVDAAAGPEDLRRLIHDLAHDLVPPPSVAVRGIAVDEMGAPLAAFMSVCTPLACQSTTAGPDGAFVIAGIQIIDFGLRSHDDSSYTPALGTVVRLMHPTEAGVFLDAGTLFVPSMPAGAKLAGQKGMPQTVLAGDGLSLTVIAQDLTFQVGDPTTAISAHRISVEHMPAYDVGSETIVAVYAFMPYSITSKSPIAIKAPIALPPGTEVRFRSVYEFQARLSAPAIGHAAKDGLSVSTDIGAGLDNLTWLLITR